MAKYRRNLNRNNVNIEIDNQVDDYQSNSPIDESIGELTIPATQIPVPLTEKDIINLKKEIMDQIKDQLIKWQYNKFDEMCRDKVEKINNTLKNDLIVIKKQIEELKQRVTDIEELIEYEEDDTKTEDEEYEEDENTDNDPVPLDEEESIEEVIDIIDVKNDTNIKIVDNEPNVEDGLINEYIKRLDKLDKDDEFIRDHRKNKNKHEYHKEEKSNRYDSKWK